MLKNNAFNKTCLRTWNDDFQQETETSKKKKKPGMKNALTNTDIIFNIRSLGHKSEKYPDRFLAEMKD
jgi:hypothetical protein